MPTTQTAKNMPYPLGDGPYGHSRPTRLPISSGKRRGAPNRLHTEAYEYDGMSNKVAPAGEYLRAPVCCSECEEFWKALILEVDEKHTSRMPAGKASLLMAKGASGRLSVLQIKSTKQHVTKERRFLPGLGCKNVTVRGDAFHSCGDAARHISTNTTSIKSGYRYHESVPEKKLNTRTMRSNHVAPAYSAYGSYAATPYANQSGLSSETSREYQLQGNLHRDAVGYNNAYGAAPKYDVISIPRHHIHGYGHVPGTDRPKSVVYPEPPENSPSFIQTRSHRSEASQAYRPEAISGGQAYFKPIRTRIDGDRRPEERFRHLSTPRRYTPMYSESFPFPQGLHHPFYTDFSQSRPFPPPATTSFPERANSRAPSREHFSHPRMYSPVPLTPRTPTMQEKQAEDFLHYNYPPKRDTQNYTEYHMSNSAGEKPSATLRQSNNNTYGFDKASLHHPPKQDDYLTSAPSHHQNTNPNPNPDSDRVNNLDIPSERTLSRTSTIESDYTTLSMPRSDCSASSSNSQDLDNDSPRSKLARARDFDTETLRPRDLKEANAASDPGIGARLKSPQRPGPGPLNNLSRTSTGTSSLMDPIVLFTGHACLSETDENSETENDDIDIAVRNPTYFKHIITNPNYLKRIVKPHAPQPPPPPPASASTQ